jgi:hypothetical protein
VTDQPIPDRELAEWISVAVSELRKEGKGLLYQVHDRKIVRLGREVERLRAWPPSLPGGIRVRCPQCGTDRPASLSPSADGLSAGLQCDAAHVLATLIRNERG